jgi:hypothetical protein
LIASEPRICGSWRKGPDEDNTEILGSMKLSPE